MSYEEFKGLIVKRSDEITTCFFMSESSDEQFQEYYNRYLGGEKLDDIIWDVVKECYGENEVEINGVTYLLVGEKLYFRSDVIVMGGYREVEFLYNGIDDVVGRIERAFGIEIERVDSSNMDYRIK